MLDPHHYPSELTELLVETIPRLFKYKRALLDFFAATGMPEESLAALRSRVAQESASISKYEITRTILKAINEAGDRSLKVRREILKRVTDWEDFSTCWDNDALKAKGLVAEVRRVVGVKDAFTRMAQERDREAADKSRAYREKLAALRERQTKLQDVRRRFGACLADTNAQRRGKQLESVLNDLFAVLNVGVRESFHVVGIRGEGIVEQIDGAIELEGRLYLVEVKWLSKAVGMPHVATFMMKLFSRGKCGGIMIVNPGLTAPGVSTLRDALTQGATAFGCTLESIFRVMDDTEPDLHHFFKRRIEAATLDRSPYTDLVLTDEDE